MMGFFKLCDDISNRMKEVTKSTVLERNLEEARRRGVVEVEEVAGEQTIQTKILMKIGRKLRRGNARHRPRKVMAPLPQPPSRKVRSNL